MVNHITDQPGFYMHQAQRLEELVPELSAYLPYTSTSILQRRQIIVQSKGMQQWLGLALSRQLGIFANTDFPFPAHFFQRLYQEAAPDKKETEAQCSTSEFAWFLFLELENFYHSLKAKKKSKAAFDILSTVINQKNDRDRYTVATTLAETLDHYLIYRFPRVKEWENGKNLDWLGELWRYLQDIFPRTRDNALSRQSELLQKLAGDDHAWLQKIPPVIIVFGVTVLPPFFLAIFHALSLHRSIHFFLLQPSMEYWHENRSKHQQARILQKKNHKEASAIKPKLLYDDNRIREHPSIDQQYFFEGNSLLASLGKYGREFFSLLDEANAQILTELRYNKLPNKKESILHLIQQDIYQNFSNTEKSDELKISKIPWQKEQLQKDNSLRIHSCYSPLREMEVLLQFILQQIQEESRKPEDFLILVPDIMTYYPYIIAVFQNTEAAKLGLNISVVDRSILHDNEIFDFIDSLVSVLKGRFSIEELNGLFQFDGFCRKIGINSEQWKEISFLAQKLFFYWGFDAQFRNDLGLPPISMHSWDTFLQKLLLSESSFAPEANEANGTFPYLPESLPIGELIFFIEKLHNFYLITKEIHKPQGWLEIWKDILNQFFEIDQFSKPENEKLFIQQIIQMEHEFNFSEARNVELTFACFYKIWEYHKVAIGRKGNFFSGKITFAELLPMRSIPAPVVAVVGLAEKNFPRKDLNTANPFFEQGTRYLGERSLYDEDRYLFLETLLSAREKLHLSYVGRSITSGRDLPPSPVLLEILDYINDRILLSDTANNTMQPAHCIVFKHPLHSFHKSYFSSRSALAAFPVFSEKDFSDSLLLQTYKHQNYHFTISAVTKPETKCILHLEVLQNMLSNPSRFFLIESLGIRLNPAEMIVPNEEIFYTNYLDSAILENKILDGVRENKSNQILLQELYGNSKLPYGNLGTIFFNEKFAQITNILQKMEKVEQTLLKIWRSQIKGAMRFHDVNSCHLQGQLSSLTTKGNIFLSTKSMGKIKESSLILKVWIEHLFLQFLKNVDGHDENFEQYSFIFSQDGYFKFASIEAAIAQNYLYDLKDILDKAYRLPIPFFPKTSMIIAKEESMESAAKSSKVLATWNNSYIEMGEMFETHYQYCFPVSNPVSEESYTIANQIYQPLLRHIQEVKYHEPL